MLAILNPRMSKLAGVSRLMSFNLHFMDDTKAPEAKQEAEKPQFPESSPTQESPLHLTPFNLAAAVLPTLWSWKLKYREANSSHKGAQLGSQVSSLVFHS